MSTDFPEEIEMIQMKENNTSEHFPKIIEKDISQPELERIYDDFKAIEVNQGIPQRKTVRFQFILEDGGKIIGYVSGITEHKWFYLTDLWVDENFRQQGHGTKLLKTIENKAEDAGMEHIYLWTAGAANALFYEKNGYKAFTVFEDKYEVKGYHQIGYRKDLK